MSYEEHGVGLVFFVTASLFVGLVTFVILQGLFSPINFVFNVFIAVGISFTYAFAAVVVVPICARYRYWAYLNNVDDWDKGEKMGLGAIWPALLIWSLTVYTIIAIATRFFRK